MIMDDNKDPAGKGDPKFQSTSIRYFANFSSYKGVFIQYYYLSFVPIIIRILYLVCVRLIRNSYRTSI